MHGCSILALVLVLMYRCAKCEAKNCTSDPDCGKNSRCIKSYCTCKDGFVSSSTAKKGTNCIKSSKQGNGLSEGEIVGIVVGLIIAVLVLAVVLAVVFYFKISKSCRPDDDFPRYHPANSSASENLSNRGQNRSDESLNRNQNIIK